MEEFIRRPRRIDRRRGERKRILEHIDIYRRGEFMQCCQLRDMSSSGVFVETRNFTLPVDTVVDIFFPLSRRPAKRRRVLRLEASVSRVALNGIGMIILGKQYQDVAEMPDQLVV